MATVFKNVLISFFPKFNSLFKSKYGTVYMNLLKTFGSAEAIANTDIRTL